MSEERRRVRWRRFAPILLILAALLAYRFLAPELPSDHEVVYELGDLADELRRLEVAWRDPQKPDDAPALHGTWHFAKGQAPNRLRATVRLPEREWEVEARLEREPPAAPLQVARRVRLRDGTNYVSLENAEPESQPPHD